MVSPATQPVLRDPNSQPGDPDGSLYSEVTIALSTAGYNSLRLIKATVRQGTVHLTGTVDSWYLKQVAQETVMQITGRGRVRNELSVVKGGARSC